MSVTQDPRDDPRRIAERWFRHHGLPWFSDQEDARIRKALRLRNVIPLVVLAVAVAAAAAVVVIGAELGLDQPIARAVAAGLVAASTVAGILVAIYALTVLRAAPILTWAFRRAFGELSILLSLVTRALPLLLLFNTFLFINTEVWQVASAMESTALWGIVLLFCAVAVAFLLSQLPKELAETMDEIAHGGVQQACEGTPLEPWAPQVDGAAVVTLSVRQRANLLLVLLVAQAFQVLLLAVAVFGFFLLFGLVAIGDDVVEAWVGTAPAVPVWHGVTMPVSHELFQVSVFLAAFSGLYFTVYAVSDPKYRDQFFTRITQDLRRAVGVRAVYQALR